MGKLEELVSSPNLEVQERASTALQLVRSIANPDIGEEQLRKELQVPKKLLVEKFEHNLFITNKSK